MVPIEAQWALWSERPNSRADYMVLSCSDGQLRAPHFDQLITRFSPGSPDGDDALPRMTVGRADIGGAPHIGLAIQTDSGNRDGVGRKIAPTSYFCVPYAALAERRVSYVGLYQALCAIPLPDSGGGPPIRITPDPLDPEQIVDDIRQFGIDTLSAAALLLTKDRQICITQAEHTTCLDRLQFLDSVAALLPYGYRARLTWGTWANSATRHRLRIFFARDVDESDRAITPMPWGNSRPPAGSAERSYYDLLAGALDRHEPVEVIRALATKIERRVFGGPEPALRELREIDERLDRASRLRSGNPTAADLRSALDDGGSDPTIRQELLIKLMEMGDGTDLARVERTLRQLPDGDLATLVPPLLNMASLLLWSPADVRLQGIVAQADRSGRQDWFLSGLIDKPPMTVAELENGLDAAVQLLVTNVIDHPNAYPATCDALGRNIPIAFRLIAQLAMADEAGRLTSGLDIVRVRLGKELSRPLDVAAMGQRARVETGEIATLADHSPVCVLTVLTIASHRRHLNLVIDAFVNWLVDCGGFVSGQDGYWNSQLNALAPEEPDIRGKLDVLLLVTGGNPSGITRVAREQWRAYRAGFIKTWQHDWPEKRRMISVLTEHLEDSQRWQQNAERADNIRDLMRAILPGGEPAIDKALEPSFPVTRRYQPSGLFTEPQPSGKPNIPPLFADRAADALAVFRAASQHGLTAKEACTQLAHEQKIPDISTALAVVHRLPIALSNLSMQTAEDWRTELIYHLCTRTFGSEIAQEFAQAYIEMMTTNLQEEVQKLEELNQTGTPNWKTPQTKKAIKELNQKLDKLSGTKKRRFFIFKIKPKNPHTPRKSSLKNESLWRNVE